MKKTKRSKLSCHDGNIPMRQEFFLSYRKKHYSRMEKADMEEEAGDYREVSPHFFLARSCAEKHAVLGLSFSNLTRVDIVSSFSWDLDRTASSHLASNGSRVIPYTSFQGRGLFTKLLHFLVRA